MLAAAFGLLSAAAYYEWLEMSKPTTQAFTSRRKPRFYLVLPNSYKNSITASSGILKPMESDHATAEQKLEVNNLENPEVYQTEVIRQ